MHVEYAVTARHDDGTIDEWTFLAAPGTVPMLVAIALSPTYVQWATVEGITLRALR